MSDSHRCCWCNVSHGWDAEPGTGPIKLHLPMAVPDDCGTAAKCAGNPMDCPGPVGGRCLGRTEEEMRGCTCSVNEWEPCEYCQRVASALEPLDVTSGLDGHRTLISRVPKGWRREGDELIPPEGWQLTVNAPVTPYEPPPCDHAYCRCGGGPSITTVQLNRESRGLLTAIKRGLGRAWRWCKH